MTTIGPPLVAVREGRFGKGVYATQDLAEGRLLLRGWGPVSRERTRHSMQIDHDRHVSIEPPMRWINHSCAPDAGLLLPLGAVAAEVYALRPIAAGEEITLDYATFEYEIGSMPDACGCGATTCRGRITGFKGLSETALAAYGRYVAEYLRQPRRAAARQS